MARMLAIAAIVVSAACSNSMGYGGSPPPPPPPPPPGGHLTTITVGNNLFSPTPDTVPAGQVTFSWATPSNGHNVTWLTAPAALPANSTPVDKASGTFAVTLGAGTYTYHCTRHTGMNGTIVVQ